MIKQWLVEKPDSEIPVGNATSLRSIIEPRLEPSARAAKHVYVVILGGNGMHRGSDSPSSDKTPLGFELGCKV